MKLNIISYTTIGKGMSGGDRIWIEFARNWARKGHQINVYVYEDGYNICQSNKLENVNYQVLRVHPLVKKSFLLLYLVRTWKGINIWRKLSKNLSENDIIYSASDFWPDTLPAYFAKKSGCFWIAGFYLFMPSPLSKQSPYRRFSRLSKGLFYWLGQLLSYRLVNKYADSVFVTSQPDIAKFEESNKRTKDAIVVIRGGVDTKLPKQVAEPKNKAYEAVFIGRFHPQKGVLQLIDIWQLVIEQKPDFRLVIIGEGPLRDQLLDKIERYSLEKNIKLYGFTDGLEKIRIFKNSKVVLHPAIYDSGGMAACEAMACGLPAIGFDLEAFNTYYPKGMVKVPSDGFKAFAEAVIKLLGDRQMYERFQKEALDWAAEWDWEKRADYVIQKIESFY